MWYNFKEKKVLGMKRISRAYVFFIGLFLLAAAPAPLLAAAEEEPSAEAVATVDGAPFFSFGEALSAWEEGTALVLLRDAEAESTVAVAGEKTLSLNGYDLSLQAGARGSVLRVEGDLTLYGEGKITGGSAEQGGGVYVDARGSLTMNGGEISGNTASRYGGGAFVVGSLVLEGEAVIAGNTDASGGESDVFLTNGNKVRAGETFAGRAGITMASDTLYRDERDVFAEGDAAALSGFFSNDKRFSASEGRLILAPLARISATYTEGEKVFPTTTLSALAERVSVTGENVNGAPYAGEIAFSLSGTLKVGAGEATVIAVGEDGEEARAQIEVPVQKPRILSVQTVPPEYPLKIYFDSPLDALTAEGGYTFKGTYDDGFSRDICASAEETSRRCGEEYIADFYRLSGDFAAREGGEAKISVFVGGVKSDFFVPVMKYAVTVSEEQVRPLSVTEGSPLDVRGFVPDLPRGVSVTATLDGRPLDAASLSPGFYTAELRFAAEDEENYEPISVTLSASLTVLANSISGRVDGMEYRLTREGGLPPDWRLNVKDVTSGDYAKFDGSLEGERIYELTLQREGIVVEDAGTLTVRLPIAEELRDKEVYLYLLGEDGVPVAVRAEREGDELIFRAASLSHARYVLAVETASRAYLILSVVFGAACALGAVALLCYLVFKRKMPLR